MRIAVVGAGGLGSKFAAYLAPHAEVTVLHRRQDYVDAVRRDGLKLVIGEQLRTISATASTDPQALRDADVVLFAVKSYDTKQVAEQVAPYLRRNAVVLTLQNGLGNREALAEVLGAERVGLAVTTEGATLQAPGVVLEKGSGVTHVGKPATAGQDVGGAAQSLAEFVDLLNAAGLKAELTDDIDGLLWAKLAMASGINPVAVVLRLKNGEIGAIPEARVLSEALIREVTSVARAKGIALAFDPLETFNRVTTATAAMTSGSLIDSLRGKRTEIGAICGAVAREARNVGVPTPYCEAVMTIVAALEASYDVRVQAVE